MLIAAAKEIPDYMWWTSFGAHDPELQQVAFSVLAQVTSTSHCERNQLLNFFTAKNEIDYHTRVRDIVFVHANPRIMNKPENINNVPENIEWDDQSSDEDNIDLIFEC